MRLTLLFVAALLCVATPVLADIGLGFIDYFQDRQATWDAFCPNAKEPCSWCIARSIPNPAATGGHNYRMVCNGEGKCHRLSGDCWGCDGPCENALIPVPSWASGGEEYHYTVGFVQYGSVLKVFEETCKRLVSQVQCDTLNTKYYGWWRDGGGVSIGAAPDWSDPDIDFAGLSSDPYWVSFLDELDWAGVIVNNQNGEIAWYQRAVFAHFRANPVGLPAAPGFPPALQSVAWDETAKWEAMEYLCWWQYFITIGGTPTQLGFPYNSIMYDALDDLVTIHAETAYYLGDWNDNPAAEVTGFSVNEHRLGNFRVIHLDRTQEFRIESAPSAQGPWADIGQSYPPTTGLVTVDLSGVPGSVFRLIEVGTNRQGRSQRITHGTALPQPSNTAAQQPPDITTLRTIVSEQTQYFLEDEQSFTAAPGSPVVILVPQEWVDVVEENVAAPARARGWTVLVRPVQAHPSDPAAFRAEQTYRFAQDYVQGYRTLFLIGGAGEHEWFTNPSWWPGPYWQAQLQDRLAAGFPPDGQPEKNWLPTFAMPDTAVENTAYASPYLFTDDPYIAGLPDATVCRWPVYELSQLYSLLTKWQTYNTFGGPFGPLNVGLLVGDRIYDDPLDADMVLDAVDQITTELDGNTVTQLLQSDYPVDAERNVAAANFWMGKDIVVLTSSAGGRYWWGWMFNKTITPPFNPSFLPVGNFPVAIAHNCNTGSSERTEDPTYGMAVGPEILQAWDRGPIVLIGPTQGSDQYANTEMSLATCSAIAQHPTDPLLASYWSAKRQFLADFANDPFAVKTAMSTQFLGDPFSPLHQVSVVVGVEEVNEVSPLFLARATPNPTSGPCTIQFSLAQAGLVTLRIYDVAGRLVRTLQEGTLPEGTFTVSWDLNNEVGQPVGAGVYYYQLAGGNQLTQKLVVLR